MTASFSLILDTVIASLLLVTITYCVLLTRKMNSLRQGKEDLDRFINEFNQAILRAEKNIDSLKDLGTDTDEKLKHHIEKARFLANDLSFLMNKGESVANTLEQQITVSRALHQQKPTGGKTPSGLAALANVRSTQPGGAAHAKSSLSPTGGIPKKPHTMDAITSKKEKENMPSSKKQALEEVLAQIASKKSKPAPIPHAAKSTPSNSTPPEKKEQVFDQRKLTESLRATQQIDS